jgi:hypothetical protein
VVRRPRDLFEPTVAAEKLNPLFRRVAHGPGHAAARKLANAVFANFHDVDRSFVREFQTGGFSARVFELALFAYLEESGLELDRTQPAPDFVVQGAMPVAIEVTTTNPVQGTSLDPGPPYPLLPDDLDLADQEFVFQLGKALRRKLEHRDARGAAYWEKPHTTGVPFVIAVGAFHGPHAQVHPDGLLAVYLYGSRNVAYHAEDGRLTVTPQAVEQHRWGSRTLMSGLFRQPEAANLAGVLFSNAHTVAKFNRVGAERGLAAPDTALMRFGTCYSFAPHASKPDFFAYVVGDRPGDERETFEESLHLFVNPWAAVPLSPGAFPGVTRYELSENGVLEATFPVSFRPFVSKTVVFEQRGADALARYLQLQVLGRLPSDARGLCRPRTTAGADANDD